MKIWIVVLASVLTAATAHAEKAGIVVSGEARLQPQVSAQLERWLHDRGRTLVPGALEPDAVNSLMDCFVLEDLGCARGIIEKRASARSVIYAKVEQTSNDDGTRDVSVTGYWFQKGSEPVAERRMCNQCTDAKLVNTVDELMLALMHAPPVGNDKPKRPTVQDMANAKAVATTDEESQPEPAAAPMAATAEQGSSPRLLPLGLIGVGGAALISGIVMVAIDEDPDPAITNRKTYRDTATAGVILGAAGSAALGVGLYLWFSQRDSHPVAAVSHDGAVVGWTGRF